MNYIITLRLPDMRHDEIVCNSKEQLDRVFRMKKQILRTAYDSYTVVTDSDTRLLLVDNGYVVELKKEIETK